MGRIFGTVDGAMDLEDAFQTDVFEFRSVARPCTGPSVTQTSLAGAYPPAGVREMASPLQPQVRRAPTPTAISRQRHEADASSAIGGLEETSADPPAGAGAHWPKLGLMPYVTVPQTEWARVAGPAPAFSRPANRPDLKPARSSRKYPPQAHPKVDVAPGICAFRAGADTSGPIPLDQPDQRDEACQRAATPEPRSEDPAPTASPQIPDSPPNGGTHSDPASAGSRPLKAPRYRFNGMVRGHNRAKAGKDQFADEPRATSGPADDGSAASMSDPGADPALNPAGANEAPTNRASDLVGKARGRRGGESRGDDEVTGRSTEIAGRTRAASVRQDAGLPSPRAGACARPPATVRTLEPRQTGPGAADTWQSELRRSFLKLRDSAA